MHQYRPSAPHPPKFGWLTNISVFMDSFVILATISLVPHQLPNYTAPTLPSGPVITQAGIVQSFELQVPAILQLPSPPFPTSMLSQSLPHPTASLESYVEAAIYEVVFLAAVCSSGAARDVPAADALRVTTLAVIPCAAGSAEIILIWVT
ncbi:hypothetical protein FIBSPDRAFT_965902 [Athelia psychrophila]|uniref:Uncharacterized protein n=1 Tax=Athelia psychrophila TaxID=1759441 RepID=A0A167XDZ8_9AGAM|nr:hypothetical protein FIBSPDRAFT_965902 [Fibularhizoctonia sp. CBS 109695]